MSCRIAVLSDTHWNRWDSGDRYTLALVETLKTGFDAIWHGGDVVASDVLDTLEAVAPVVVVKGNCDTFMGRALPHSVVENVEGVKIAMIHGWDLPLGHAPTVVSRFPNDVRLIIHGHTHLRRQEDFVRADGSVVTLLNPGSVSSPRGGETAGMAELLIDGEDFQYNFIEFE